MLTLKAKIRSISGKETKNLRKQGILPAVLYGPGLKKSLSIEVNEKEFAKVFQGPGGVGETSFLKLEVLDGNEYLVLVHDLQKDPLTQTIFHIDFYHPSANKEIKVTVPLVFENESMAVKNLNAVLIKNIQEVQVQALPKNLPHEIKVDISYLDVLGKTILIKDLTVPEGVKILKHPEEIVIQAREMEKVEEELAKPTEEKVEEVKVVEKEKKEEEPKA